MAIASADRNLVCNFAASLTRIFSGGGSAGSRSTRNTCCATVCVHPARNRVFVGVTHSLSRKLPRRVTQDYSLRLLPRPGPRSSRDAAKSIPALRAIPARSRRIEIRRQRSHRTARFSCRRSVPRSRPAPQGPSNFHARLSDQRSSLHILQNPLNGLRQVRRHELRLMGAPVAIPTQRRSSARVSQRTPPPERAKLRRLLFAEQSLSYRDHPSGPYPTTLGSTIP